MKNEDLIERLFGGELPPYPSFKEGIRRAPHRESHLSEADMELALKNALRYIPKKHH